jgi:tetratricopeptide (TPR) repeat protein
VTRKVQTFFILCTVLFPLSISAAEGRPSVDAQIDKAVVARDFLLQRRYADAESFLKGVVSEWPEELIGYFGLMALYQVRNLDNYDYRFDPAYLEWEAKGRPLALKIARNPTQAEAWDLLMAGGTLGVSGFYRGHNHKWFAGLRDASLGFHTIEKSYAKDQTLSDALLGTGLYDYWRSHHTRKLHFLPFFADRRPEGKASLERAVKEARFTGVLAEIGLTFIDYQEKAYDKAIATVDRFLGRYPGNTILRTLKGECLIGQKKYAEAVKEFERVLAFDPKLTKSYLLMGIALAKEGKDKDRARELIQKFLRLEPNANEDWRTPALEHLKKLESTDRS